MILKAVFAYKKPKLAIAALVTLIFVLVVGLSTQDHLEKFGFLLGTGLGIFWLVLAGKAMKHQYGNLAILMYVSGLLMLATAIFATPDAVLAASSLEDLVPAIIGAVGGIFSGIDSEE